MVRLLIPCVSHQQHSKFLPPQICNIILEMSFEELMHAAFRILIFLVRPLRPTLPNAHECFIALIKQKKCYSEDRCVSFEKCRRAKTFLIQRYEGHSRSFAHLAMEINHIQRLGSDSKLCRELLRSPLIVLTRETTSDQNLV